MLDKPEITRSVAGPTAMIHLTIPREQMGSVMHPAITELMATMAQQGIAPAGPMFTHHLRIEPEIFDFELSVPVTEPITAAGRVQPGYLPETTVARTVYQGGYEGLGAAWKEFDTWLAANGHERAGNLWECYVVGPDTNPDPTAWRTELNRPLVDH